MTPTQFTTAAARTRMAPHSVAAARRVLVDGESMYSVAIALGVSRSTIHKAVSRIRDASRSGPLVKVVVWVDPETAERIREMAG